MQNTFWEQKGTQWVIHHGFGLLPDGNPVLAAEPDLHHQAPSGDEVVVPFGHSLTRLPDPFEDFTENHPEDPPDQRN